MTGSENERSLTLTHYTIEGQRYGYASLDAAERALQRCGAASMTTHVHAYRVGDLVEVHHRGAWRSGEVVHLKRVRVVVHFKKNRRGEIGAKDVYGSEIRPRSQES